MHHKWHFQYLRHDRKVASLLVHRAALSNFMTYEAFGNEAPGKQMVMKSHKNQNYSKRRH